MKSKNIFNFVCGLIVFIVIFDTNVIDFLLLNQKNNNKNLYPQKINLASSFITNEINIDQVINDIKTIISQNRGNIRTIDKVLPEYINRLNSKNKLVIAKQNNGAYKITITKQNGAVCYEKIIDFINMGKIEQVQSKISNKPPSIREIIKQSKLVIFTSDSYLELSKYIKLQECKEEYRELDVLDCFDRREKPQYRIIFYRGYLEDSNVQINAKKQYIVIPCIAIPRFNNNFILESQILYDLLEWINIEYKSGQKLLFCEAYSSELLQKGLEYKTVIDKNPDINIDFNLIKSETLRYYVFQYQRMWQTLRQIESFNKKNNFKSSKQWIWDKISDMPEKDKQEKFIACHPEYPKNKIVYIPHKEGATYMIVSDFHGNCRIQDGFKKVAQKFKALRKAGENVTLILDGDYVDRGPDLIWDEIIDLYNEYPENVIILGGNHEATRGNLGRLNFGITYLKNTPIIELYESLPSMCIVHDYNKDRIIVIMHGGIPVEWQEEKGAHKLRIISSLKEWQDGEKETDLSLSDWRHNVEENEFTEVKKIPNCLQLCNNPCFIYDYDDEASYKPQYLRSNKNMKTLANIFGKKVYFICGHIHCNIIGENNILTVCSSNATKDGSEASYLYINFDNSNKMMFIEIEPIVLQANKESDTINSKKNNVQNIVPLPLNIGKFISHFRENKDTGLVNIINDLDNLNKLTKKFSKENFISVSRQVMIIMNKLLEILKKYAKVSCVISKENVNFTNILKEFPNLYIQYLDILVRGHIGKNTRIKLKRNQAKEYEYKIKYHYKLNKKSIKKTVVFNVSNIDVATAGIANTIESIFLNEFQIDLGLRVYDIAKFFVSFLKLEKLENTGLVKKKFFKEVMNSEFNRKILQAV
jgi:hypothetical protein